MTEKSYYLLQKLQITKFYLWLQLHMRPAAINKYLWGLLFPTVALRIFATSRRYDSIIEANSFWAWGSLIAFYYPKRQVKTIGLSKIVIVFLLQKQKLMFALKTWCLHQHVQ